MTCTVVWADEAFTAAQTYMADDREGLVRVFDTIDLLAENPRPPEAFAGARTGTAFTSAGIG